MADFVRFLLPALRAAAWASDIVAPPPPVPVRHRHSRPIEECPIAASGWPYYMAGITVGGPISDFGSHAGLKAAVTPAGRASGRDLLEAAHYAAFTTVASRIDRSRLRFEGARLARTAIEFAPWGWRETARDGDLEAEGRVATIAEDAFLFAATLENRGAAPLLLTPRFELLDDPDPAHEAQQPLRFSRPGRVRAALDGAGLARVAFRRKTGPGPLAFDATRFARSFRASFGPPRLARLRGRFHVALAGVPFALAPGARAEVFVVEGAGENEAEADRALARGEAALEAAGRPAALFERIAADWARHLAALPAPADLAPEDRRTLELAATGLRMSAFAPRGRMPCRATLPSKVHFNLFAAWDLAFQALGLAEWDLPLAKETLTCLLTAQRRSGILAYAFGPDMAPFHPMLETISQPPAVALALREVFERDGARDRAWLAPLYERLARYARWWEEARDLDRDGLFSYRCAFESGWDDTPRIPNPRVPPIRALDLDLANLSGLAPAHSIAAVDLNSWMFILYESLGALAEHLGRDEEAAIASGKARALGERVEAVLWDEEAGAYFDREIGPGGAPARFMRAVTPALAWPLFAGIARDRGRVRRVVERHILDPEELWGDPENGAAPRFPVPTVAYRDPSYNRADDGYYWRGQVWLVPCFAVLVGLHRYGYAAEAATLRRRVLRLLAGACAGGLFENYDALTGAVGFGSGSLSGAGEPACFQIGLTTATAALVALRSYERFPRVLARPPA
jgi:hypothetical protein